MAYRVVCISRMTAAGGEPIGRLSPTRYDLVINSDRLTVDQAVASVPAVATA